MPIAGMKHLSNQQKTPLGPDRKLQRAPGSQCRVSRMLHSGVRAQGRHLMPSIQKNLLPSYMNRGKKIVNMPQNIQSILFCFLSGLYPVQSSAEVNTSPNKFVLGCCKRLFYTLQLLFEQLMGQSKFPTYKDRKDH